MLEFGVDEAKLVVGLVGDVCGNVDGVGVNVGFNPVLPLSGGVE